MTLHESIARLEAACKRDIRAGHGVQQQVAVHAADLRAVLDAVKMKLEPVPTTQCGQRRD